MSRENTHVVHISDGIRDAIYVGPVDGHAHLSPSPFANPFTEEDFGHRRLALMAYTEELRFGALHYLLALLPALRGKPLACRCRHHGEALTDDNVCHADILVRLLEMYTDDELRAMAVESDHLAGCPDMLLRA